MRGFIPQFGWLTQDLLYYIQDSRAHKVVVEGLCWLKTIWFTFFVMDSISDVFLGKYTPRNLKERMRDYFEGL